METIDNGLLTPAALELKRRIAEKGPVTFAEFMETALYWPGGGYYTSAAGGTWGRSGDYVTSLDLSPVFARVMARVVAGMWEALGGPPGFTLIEAGAGRGWLTAAIVETLKAQNPPLYAALSARLVEKNEHLRGPGPSFDGRLTWHGDLSELAVAPYGCVVTNELVDSLPVHAVLMTGEGLREIYVDHDGSSFREAVGPLSNDEIGRHLSAAGVALVPGQRCEVNLAAVKWIKDAAALIEKGFVVTVDYGHPARELYAPERGAGTVHCHSRQRLNFDPYRDVGLQDITAHVDFTALARAGMEAGLQVTGFATQKDFLIGAGVLDELRPVAANDPDECAKVVHNRSVALLINPGGAGDAFKVLVQHKGIGRPSLPCFSFRDLAPRLFSAPARPDK